ncbi:metaxin-1-like [Ostrea edulis]|uniref:metaxin-1-like n=1 Tax=Ostrea edulis TaxID=37623 RepID=UPI0020957BF0|nr:metaxin-1-like [Ostrea edulis]
MADEIKTLEVWSGEWGLPSFDHKCLAVQSYCKFSGIPVKVTARNNPLRSPSGSLPVFRNGDAVKCGVISIFEYLKEQNFGNDVSLSRKLQADNKAFLYFLEEKLKPAYLHSWWVDAHAFTETTRPLYAKACGFPLSLYVTKKMMTSASNEVYTPLQKQDVTEEDIDKLIYKEAKECINLLSYKLGEQDFFFGDCPTSLDAMVFGYIAPLIKGPLTSNQLVKHIENCPNLCNHTNRILSRFFPLSQDDVVKMRKEEQERSEALKRDALDFPNKTRNMILAGLFAATAMMAYAYSSGVVRIQDNTNGEDYEGEEEDEN